MSQALVLDDTNCRSVIGCVLRLYWLREACLTKTVYTPGQGEQSGVLNESMINVYLGRAVTSAATFSVTPGLAPLLFKINSAATIAPLVY